jgi:hypothetical protein
MGHPNKKKGNTMVTERRIIVEKHHWLPVQIDDGADAALVIVLLLGLGLIAYAIFAPHHASVMSSDTAGSAPAASSSSADTGTGSAQ